MIKIRIDLDDAMHARLRLLGREQGRTMSDLVRDALMRAYGLRKRGDRAATLRAVEGLWRGRRDLGPTDAYVRRLRGGPRRRRDLSG
jgi:hypothetical protein